MCLVAYCREFAGHIDLMFFISGLGKRGLLSLLHQVIKRELLVFVSSSLLSLLRRLVSSWKPPLDRHG